MIEIFEVLMVISIPLSIVYGFLILKYFNHPRFLKLEASVLIVIGIFFVPSVMDSIFMPPGYVPLIYEITFFGYLGWIVLLFGVVDLIVLLKQHSIKRNQTPEKSS